MSDQQLVSTLGVPRMATLRSGRTDWIHRWLDGEMPDASTLDHHGFQASQYYAVAIYRPVREAANASNPVTSAQLAAFLHTEASRRNICGPVFPYDTQAAVLFHPVEDPQQTTRLKRKTEEIRKQLSARLHGVDIQGGVGRPARGMEHLRQSFHEAENAVRLNDELGKAPCATFFGNSSLFMLLRSLRNPHELSHFCDTWLADLIAYDERQHSDLLVTLRTYFANNGNTALTAKELRIHRNTLAYRLNRIAEITHLDLEDADVRLNLHLALKALEVINAAR